MILHINTHTRYGVWGYCYRVELAITKNCSVFSPFTQATHITDVGTQVTALLTKRKGLGPLIILYMKNRGTLATRAVLRLLFQGFVYSTSAPVS